MKHTVLGALVALLFAPAPPAAASGGQVFDLCTPQHKCRELGDPELERIRGGFAIETPAGTLDISIGITRAVAINGQLVTLSQLVLPDASQIVAGARAQADTALASSKVDKATAIAAATAGIGTQGSAVGTSAPQSAASGNTAVGQPAAQPQLANAVIVQNGSGNVAILSGGSNLAVLPTVIQNTLNNQVITSATLLNITTNSLSVFRSMALGDLLNNARIVSGR